MPMKVSAKGLISLGRQPYSFASAIAELIDNSIGAGSRWVDIHLTQQGGVVRVRVVDDGQGMDFAALENAINVGSESEGGINEHGVGMKQALSWLKGDLNEPWSIHSKSENNDAVYCAFDDAGGFEIESREDGPQADGAPGTSVEAVTAASKLVWAPAKQLKSRNPSDHVDWLRAFFGATYRRVLRQRERVQIRIQYNDEPMRDVGPVEPETDGNDHAKSARWQGKRLDCHSHHQDQEEVKAWRWGHPSDVRLYASQPRRRHLSSE